MRTSYGNNTKHRLEQFLKRASEQQAALVRRVRYIGSTHHKHTSSDYVLTQSNLQRDKIYRRFGEYHCDGGGAEFTHVIDRTNVVSEWQLPSKALVYFGFALR